MCSLVNHPEVQQTVLKTGFSRCNARHRIQDKKHMITTPKKLPFSISISFCFGLSSSSLSLLLYFLNPKIYFLFLTQGLSIFSGLSEDSNCSFLEEFFFLLYSLSLFRVYFFPFWSFWFSPFPLQAALQSLVILEYPYLRDTKELIGF